MKNYFIYVLLLSFIAIGCSDKCVECSDCPDDVTLTDASGNDVASLEVCEDDFDTKEEYDQVISLTEGFGWECK